MTEQPAGKPVFEKLRPHIVTSVVEKAFGLTLNGVLTPYPSYINRVYGLTAEDGRRFAVKFYRPGRWEYKAILEEHEFLFDCAAEEIPVVTPIQDSEGDTLQEISFSGDAGENIFFCLFPLKSGRNFEPTGDESWLRLGRLIGRVHSAGRGKECLHRLSCLPETTTRPYIRELEESGLTHPDVREDFNRLLEQGMKLITPLFETVKCRRIHGDCHSGNILDRPGEGLLLFDFDDMMSGPAVQDLWLLLPDHASEAGHELNLLLKGYEEFLSFDRSSLKLIEPLRFMRMVYFLLWTARQRRDYDFERHFPGWGTKAFWLKECEDFRYQIRIIEEEQENS